jgi:hypothetical protein
MEGIWCFVRGMLDELVRRVGYASGVRRMHNVLLLLTCHRTCAAYKSE